MKATMKKFGSTVLLLAGLALSVSACSTMGSGDMMADHMDGEDNNLYRRLPATEHHKKFPGGHGVGEGKACFYDRVEDMYFCSFSQ